MQQLLTISIYSKRKVTIILLWVSESLLFLYIQTCGCLDGWEGDDVLEATSLVVVSGRAQV